MVLEAVMVCVDNSDFTRNGDYAPSRFDSQTDAVNLLCGAKTSMNPENSVGILCTAGDRIDVMITPTSDLGKIISELPKITVGGYSDLLRGVQTAQLALKHRQNKNQKQRVVAFVGSPVLNTEKELETLGKNLKKNNVSLDIISFGEVEQNTPKLEKLIAAVNSNDSSHLLEIPAGPKLISDVLLSSVIVNPDGPIGDGAGGGGGEGFAFGINPEDDPELALALRISMEEEKARQQAASGGDAVAAAPGAEAEAATATASSPNLAPPLPPHGNSVASFSVPDTEQEFGRLPSEVPQPATAAPADLPMADDAALIEAMGMDDMDEELRQALLLSLQDPSSMDVVEPAPATSSTGDPADKTGSADKKEESQDK